MKKRNIIRDKVFRELFVSLFVLILFLIFVQGLPTVDNFFMNTSDVNNYTNGTINVSFGLSEDLSNVSNRFVG